MVVRRFKWTTAKLALGMVVALLALAAPAAAGPPQTGEGVGMITGLDITSMRDAGGNSIQDREIEGWVEGTLEGDFVEHVSGVVHRNGLVTFSGTMTFTGRVGECGSGTITLGLSGRGQAGLPVTEAHVRVINQASNTVDVTGTGTVHQVGPELTYEIQYVCR